MRALHVEPLRWGDAPRRVIEAAAIVDYASPRDQHELLELLGRAPYEALFLRLGLAADRAVFDRAPGLRLVITPTTGLDHLDLAEAEARGIRVISLRGETALLERVSSTAEHTFALLLGLFRRLPAAHADVLAGRWRREPFLAAELSGRTLGIAGCGRLGRKVARYALAFELEVLVHDLDPAALALAPAGALAVSPDELLARSDVLSLHLPLNAATSGWLSRARLASMKRGSVLVNTARGELVDEAALLEALELGHLAGAALDVLTGDSRWSEDGPGPDHPLIDYARRSGNLLLTPHTGGYGRDSIARTRLFVAERFAAAVRELRGSNPMP